MRKIRENVFTEIYFWGCNPGFVVTDDGIFMIDTPQQPIDAVRWREKIQQYGTIRYLVNTEPHSDHIMGNAYFPGIEVIGQTGMRERYDKAIEQMTSPERTQRIQENDPDSVWLLNHPSYPPNPPTTLFDKSVMVELGEHKIHCLHHPGHTPPQTSVYIPKEGVVFTGDNVFCRVKTFIQEANPWDWLSALEAINGLDVEIIVPGHGEPCGKDYLKEQAQIINDWVGAVQQFIERGLPLDDALQEPVPQVDPYPIGQRLFGFSADLDKLIIKNLYTQIQEIKPS